MSNVVHWGGGESVQRVWTILGFNLRAICCLRWNESSGKRLTGCYICHRRGIWSSKPLLVLTWVEAKRLMLRKNSKHCYYVINKSLWAVRGIGKVVRASFGNENEEMSALLAVRGSGLFCVACTPIKRVRVHFVHSLFWVSSRLLAVFTWSEW